MDLSNLRKAVDTKLHQYQAAVELVKAERAALRTARDKHHDLEAAQVLAQEVATQIQELAHEKIATLVSKSLEAVFDEPYQFKINFEQRRGKTEADLTFERDGLQVDPMTASGGGVVDVAAFSLRLSSLLLSQPPLRRFLALDEPFRFVSADYRERVALLIRQLATDAGCQFLIVTHQKEYRIGTIVEL